MKFTKLAKSEKFEYMMLSRLIQDAKYFIEHPDFKHLWARTLDEHIKQMKEQYAKLDPKPEWTSEEEINNLAKQMKESYINHWNEIHPDNRIEAAIQQPNKPKPTTMLPDNMQWAWDPDAADWVAVLKDNTNTTPPLYDPNNQNVTNQTTSYMSNIKSASVIDGDEDEEPLWVRLKDLFLSDGSLVDSYIKNEINCDDILNALNIEIKNKIDYKKVCDYIEEFINDNYMSDIKSSCLSKFLDGPQYSKEIKIEAGLIKEGLVKYAGFDFNRGTKYAITTKGLEVLRRASEAEHNDALNEREKLAYLFGFNTDEVSTLDTTGKTIKSEEITDEQLEKSWNKYYPLYRKDIEEEKMTEENYPADDEVAQKLKTTLSMYLYGLKRYRKAIPIMKYHTNAKMKRAVEDGHSKGLSEDEITKQVDAIAEEYYKKENKIKPTFNSLSEDYLKSFLFGIIKNKKSASLNKLAKQWNIFEVDGTPLGKVTASSELDAKVKFGVEHPEYADSQSISAKEIDNTESVDVEIISGINGDYYRCEGNNYEIFDSSRYPKFGITSLANLIGDRKVNYIKGQNVFKGEPISDELFEALKNDLNKHLSNNSNKNIDAKYEETTEQHLDYPNPSETPTTDVIIENHDGWVNTAAKDKPKVTPEFAKLHSILSKYHNKGLIDNTYEMDGNLVVVTRPGASYDLRNEVENLGFKCDEVDETTNFDIREVPTYSLIIKMK